jgi:hypothetical protein
VLQRLESSGATLTRLSAHPATLEDLFVQLTGRQVRE